MIRYATEADIPAIQEMGRKFWALTDYSDIPYHAEDFAVMIKACIGIGMVIVLDVDGVQGFVLGVKGPMLANHDYEVGSELAWWVEEECRNKGYGKKLKEGIEQAARNSGIRYWNMMNLESVSPEISERIYLNSGYKKSETTFLKVL